MRQPSSNRRTDPRLDLAYPIRLRSADGEVSSARDVTRDLSARGAYFSTYDATGLSAGLAVDVSISVPHRLAGGGRQIVVDLRGPGRVVRVEASASGVFVEDGLPPAGVAVRFERPLSVHLGLG